METSRGGDQVETRWGHGGDQVRPGGDPVGTRTNGPAMKQGLSGLRTSSVLAPMLYVATVNETPPGIEARAATGVALLLAMAAAPAKVRVVWLTSLRNSCVVED